MNDIQIFNNPQFGEIRTAIGENGERYNIPNQQYVEMGLFEIKKGVRSGNDGVLYETKTPEITAKDSSISSTSF